MSPIPTYVVNLPEDEDRLQILLGQLDPSIFEIRESLGFLGRTLPDTACLLLTGDPASIQYKGALGVMFSHVSLWERIAQLQAPFALVLEDDVELIQPERLAGVELPDGFDIVFCGDQTAVHPVGTKPIRRLQCISAIWVLSALERRGVSVGAYGYLLSPSGARRLLSLFDQHRFFGHVDVRMMAYCCELRELNRLPSTGRLLEELRAIRGIVGDPPKLAGYALMHPLVVHSGMTSRRDREDMLGKMPAHETDPE